MFGLRRNGLMFIENKVPVWLRGYPSWLLNPSFNRACRVDYERTRRHKERRERCFARFRVLHIDQIRGLPKAGRSTHSSGVYFLWSGPKLLYIGKSSGAIHDRLADHIRRGKVFTHATYEALNPSCAQWCESEYIKRYRPPLNLIGK